MRYLLDTHAFLWWVLDDPQLSATARKVVADDGAEVFVSVVTAWEVIIKQQAGKEVDLERLFPGQLLQNGFQALPVTLDHVRGLASLPPLHKDPFDRLLIGQAISDRCTLITNDHLVRQYAVASLW